MNLDLRYSLRALRRQPGFTLLAILTLALGIGAATAIFSVVDATLLRPLPFPHPGELMQLSLVTPQRASLPSNFLPNWSYPKARLLTASQTSFSAIALHRAAEVTLVMMGTPAAKIPAEAVQASYFPLLGIAPALGRTFTDREDAPGQPVRTVLSHALWQRLFAGDPAVIGRRLEIDNLPVTVIGVMPPRFNGLSAAAELWLPLAPLDHREFHQPHSHNPLMIGRLRTGVSSSEAEAEVAAIGKRIADAYPDPLGVSGWGASAKPLEERRADPFFRRTVLILFGAVSLVLLIACGNVAGLLLARAASRQAEFATRRSLGATRARLARQLFVESALLAGGGAMLGIALAAAGVRLIRLVDPTSGAWLGRPVSGLTALAFQNLALDGRVLGFTIAIAAITVFLCGFAPALHGTRNVVRGGQSPALRLRQMLIAGQVALAVVLLVAATLTTRSLSALIDTRLGAQTRNVLTARVSYPFGSIQPEVTAAAFQRVERGAAALPGVLAAGLGSCHPLAGGCSQTIAYYFDRENPPRGGEPRVATHFISASYFRALEIPLIAGRMFTDADTSGRPRVMILSETAARQLFPGEDPVGKRLGIGQGGFHAGAEVVGVVGDVLYRSQRQQAGSDVYVPHLQTLRAALFLHVRAAGDPRALVPALREAVRRVDPSLPLHNIKTMTERISSATADSRFSATLLGAFALTATLLAAFGIYGLLAYALARRTREIGIRMALGAGPAHISGTLLRQSLQPVLFGLLAGVPAAAGCARLLESMLFRTSPADPASYAAGAGLILGAAVAASLLPARWALRIAPSEALRSE
ncbi:MAG: ABC transporter permease [Bryobacteraceae bacterium]|nr:ABC transporter permease [Bryobacteraceae bacterium]